jgi:hypothetical protein
MPGIWSGCVTIFIWALPSAAVSSTKPAFQIIP